MSTARMLQAVARFVGGSPSSSNGPQAGGPNGRPVTTSSGPNSGTPTGIHPGNLVQSSLGPQPTLGHTQASAMPVTPVIHGPGSDLTSVGVSGAAPEDTMPSLTVPHSAAPEATMPSPSLTATAPMPSIEVPSGAVAVNPVPSASRLTVFTEAGPLATGVAASSSLRPLNLTHVLPPHSVLVETVRDPDSSPAPATGRSQSRD